MKLAAVASRIERLSSVDAIWSEALTALEAVGIEIVIYLTNDNSQQSPFLLTNRPEIYQGFDLATEPFLEHCCQSYAITMTGSAFATDYTYLKGAQRALIERAVNAGFRSGLGIPMRLRGSDRYGGFNLGTGLEREVFETRIQPLGEELRFFCLLVHRRIEELLVDEPTAGQDVFRQRLISPHAELMKTLSPREQEIMYLIARGLSRKECARLCQISLHTVGEYTKNAYRKLGVRNRVEVARIVDNLKLT